MKLRAWVFLVDRVFDIVEGAVWLYDRVTSKPKPKPRPLPPKLKRKPGPLTMAEVMAAKAVRRSQAPTVLVPPPSELRDRAKRR